MKHTESEAYELIDACNENINSGDVNSAGSYDEGVRGRESSVRRTTVRGA